MISRLSRLLIPSSGNQKDILSDAFRPVNNAVLIAVRRPRATLSGSARLALFEEGDHVAHAPAGGPPSYSHWPRELTLRDLASQRAHADVEHLGDPLVPHVLPRRAVGLSGLHSLLSCQC